jgi:hypothetical protein
MDNVRNRDSAVRCNVFRELRRRTARAWEADALPTELFPHSDLRVPYLDLGPNRGQSPTGIIARSPIPRLAERPVSRARLRARRGTRPSALFLCPSCPWLSTNSVGLRRICIELTVVDVLPHQSTSAIRQRYSAGGRRASSLTELTTVALLPRTLYPPHPAAVAALSYAPGCLGGRDDPDPVVD